MLRLGEINKIPVYIANRRSEIFDDNNSGVYIIYKDKVWMDKHCIGTYDRRKNAVTWSANTDEQMNEKKECKTCHSNEDCSWDEMLKPVDDMIAEMLGRGL